MRRVLPLVAVLLMGFAPAPFPKDRNKIDLKKMQGEWVQIREESANFGVTYPQATLVIVGNEITKSDWSGLGICATIVLDAGSSPKTLELQYHGARTENNILRKAYRLDGDLLELCYDPVNWKKAPRKISGKQDGLIVETYRRKNQRNKP